MTCLAVNYSKGQMKIQQMAFVLVAVMIFFGMVALIYFSISFSNIKDRAESLREKEAREIVKKISSSPEFSSDIGDCSSCVDLDKVLMLKEEEDYKKFWNLDYLVVEKISNKTSVIECTKVNYPDCDKITIIEKTQDFGLVDEAFVTLIRWDPDLGSSGSFRYELGRVYASGN